LAAHAESWVEESFVGYVSFFSKTMSLGALLSAEKAFK
jgi:hypothetical protein